MFDKFKTLFRRRLASQPHRHYTGDHWPFDQPRNCTTITMRQVLDGSEQILLVAHDANDHAWQFIGSSHACTEDGGWYVWRRWSRAIRACFRLPICRRAGWLPVAAPSIRGSVAKAHRAMTTLTKTARPDNALQRTEAGGWLFFVVESVLASLCR